jgi:hypothetical protein
MNGILPLKKSELLTLQKFSTEFENGVVDFAQALFEVYDDFRVGRVGRGPKSVASNLLGQWLIASQLPTLDETQGTIDRALADYPDYERRAKRLSKTLPFPEDAIRECLDRIESATQRGEPRQDAISDAVWELFTEKVNLYFRQCAYVVLGRLVTLFVMEDKRVGLPPALVSGTRSQAYWKAIEDLHDLLPRIFAFNEFDWWYVNPTEAISAAERVVLDAVRRKIEAHLVTNWKMLRAYEYSLVNTDVWNDIYLKVLPEENRKKLGFVPTPTPIVDLILDLVNYVENRDGLCRERLLDPACGSGTFLVEAAVRLLAHLDSKLPCHSGGRDVAEWEAERIKLKSLFDSLTGIDIHPFATFLTSLNLTFLVVDRYVAIRRYDPSFALEFGVVTHDALADPTLVGLTEATNGRLQEVLRRQSEYSRIARMKFSAVVGNPPWGGVLVGRVGPLGDEAARIRYRNKFGEVAAGKSDIYVLFIAQGVAWLKEEGVLGLIIPITFLSQAFGRGIRKLLSKRLSPTYLVDLSTLGPLLFPGFTNYPCVLAGTRSRETHNVKFIEVNVDG